MSLPALTVHAPAKINLSLRVLGRREDGFHELETLMVPLALADELTLAPEPETGGIDLRCDDPTLPGGLDNLAGRAASAFYERTGLAPGVRIELRKRIPHGAGLGGGSSDAAAVLRGLNQLHEAGLSTAELSELASALGSDVPFFLHRSAAWCRGRGERVEPVAFPERLPLLLLKPGFGVPTPWAYGRWRDSRELPGVRYAAQPFPWGELVNDLERPVFEKYLLLPALKTWLREQPEVAGALMSGSGSTTLAVLHRETDGPALARRVRETFGDTLWVCPTRTAGVEGAASSGAKPAFSPPDGNFPRQT